MENSESLIIRPRTLDDDAEVVSIMNENMPSWPPESVESFRFDADPKQVPPGGIVERNVAVLDGVIVGRSLLGYNWVFQRPHTFAFALDVRKSRGRQGIGTRLLDSLMARAESYGATRLYGQYVEGDARGANFARKYGFAETGRAERMSRLEVASANLEGYEGLEERIAASGIVVTTLAETGTDESLMRRIHHLMHDVEKDIPATEEWAEDPFDIWLHRRLHAPTKSPERFWMAMDGDRPVAMAELELHDERTASNGLTGTYREYRGRGLARALKQRQILWARDHGVEYIHTGNDLENAPMLSINIPLGYKAVPSVLEVIWNSPSAEP